MADVDSRAALHPKIVVQTVQISPGAMARQILDDVDLELREAPPEEQGTLANLQIEFAGVDMAFALVGGNGSFNHALRREIMERWNRVRADIARISHSPREAEKTPPAGRPSVADAYLHQRRAGGRAGPGRSREPREGARMMPLEMGHSTLSVNGYQREGRAGGRGPPATRGEHRQLTQIPRGREASRRADPEHYDDEESDYQPRSSRHGYHGPQAGYGRHNLHNN